MLINIFCLTTHSGTFHTIKCDLGPKKLLISANCLYIPLKKYRLFEFVAPNKKKLEQRNPSKID